MITTNSINITLIYILVIFRVVTDLIWFYSKPSWNMALYMIILLIFFINNIKLFKQKNIFIYFYLLFFMVIGSSTSHYFEGVLAEQIKETIKTSLPALFLLIASKLDIDYATIRKRFRYIFIPVLLLGLIHFQLFYGVKVNQLYNFFYCEPNHVLSQTISKIFFIYINNIYIMSAFVLFIFILNVRSTLFPVTVSYCFQMIVLKKDFILKTLVTIMIMTVSYYMYTHYDELLARTLYRGRSEAGIRSLSSGRNEIYSKYIYYMITNFSFFEWIFGVGYLNRFGGTITHVGHNDILNVLSQFGITGIIFFTTTYYQIQKKLDSKYRKFLIPFFLFVSMTNGIIFHQSNIILALYFKGTDRSNEEK